MVCTTVEKVMVAEIGGLVMAKGALKVIEALLHRLVLGFVLQVLFTHS
jgi:hypothetical protein